MNREPCPLENHHLLTHRRRRIRKRAAMRLGRKFWRWCKRNEPEEYAEEIANGWRWCGRYEFEEREETRYTERETDRLNGLMNALLKVAPFMSAEMVRRYGPKELR